MRADFARMAMDDEETVALTAPHCWARRTQWQRGQLLGPAPEGAELEEQGLGWNNHKSRGIGRDTVTSGIEGAWTTHPTQWDKRLFHLLFKYDWALRNHPPARISGSR